MKQPLRQAVYQKFQGRFKGRCAYCGKEIEYKDMQIDHIKPKRAGGTDSFDNLHPACRRCNHYKNSMNVETFRMVVKTLHDRIRKNYICKVAEDYGIIEVREWDGRFYFEGESEV